MPKGRTLRHAGYEVVDAACGADALALTEQLRPALVVLDVRMPDMSGIEVCRSIKQRWPRHDGAADLGDLHHAQ